MRKAILLVALLIFSTLPSLATADEDPVRQRSSMTDFTWSGNANTVQVAGEWDNWTEHINLSESGGEWSASVEIPPGMYCYKLIVDGNWIFDPTAVSYTHLRAHET